MVLNTIKGIWTVVKAVFNVTLGPVLKGALTIIQSLTKGISGLFRKLDESEDYLNAFGKAAEWISEKLQPFATAVGLIAEGIAKFITALFDGKSVGEAFEGSFFWVVTMFDTLNGNGTRTPLKLKSTFSKIKKLAEDLGNTFKHIGETIGTAFDAFQQTDLGQSLSGAFERLKNKA